MSVHLYDIIDCDELREAIEAKHIREQTHPTEPLAILNYTEACVYDNAWNDTTLKCRGLIYNTTNGDVMARPFPKFFNYGQTGAAEIPLDAEVVVTDKIDGSLAVIYRRPSDGKLAVATRGSFTSEQAIKATEMLHTDRYKTFREDGYHSGTTYLAEVIYPANRIVLDYGDREDLVLLGSVDISSGVIDDPEVASGFGRWPKDLVTQTFPFRSFAEALTAAPRPNAEGFVVRRRYSGNITGSPAMIKLKQEDYVALHKIVTGLSARTVWQHIVDGKHIKELILPLPDEFHGWVIEVANGINHAAADRLNALSDAYQQILQTDPTRFTVGTTDDARAVKKRFAMAAKDHPDSWAMFAFYDGRDILAKIWDEVRPEAFITPSGRTYTEDAA